MLVLTRKPGEQIVIGHGIRVTVVSVGPGRVKIGVEAPPEVRVDRAEIHERVLAEQGVDVLAAVGRAEVDGPSPTVVAAGDTATRLPNPLPPAAPARHPAVERLIGRRLPHKPR
ncbi:MAG: carbon storage regulator [Gemmataceae bacterium]|nr:carbon storage regulator [Gemmataceae bacterium]